MSDIIFLLVVSLLIFLLPNFVLNDGSTGWHLLTGRYILEHRAIPTTDLFSYTFPGKPWVPYEWLFDVIAACFDKLGGIKLVAVATACAVAGLFAKLYQECRKVGCHFIVATILCILAIIVSTIHCLARPHIFTWFGVLIVTRCLERFRRGEQSVKGLLTTLALTMIVWANAHPAFLVGLVLVALYVVSELFVAAVNSSAARRDSLTRATWLGIGLVVSFVGTLINPNAAHLYTYIFQYLHHGAIIANTSEFMAPDWHQLHAKCMLIILAAFVGGLAITRKRIALAPLLTMFAVTWLGLTGMRNEPLFVCVAVPLTAELFAEMNFSELLSTAGGVLSPVAQRVAAWWRKVGTTVDEVEFQCDMHLAPILCGAVLCISCLFGGKIGGVEIVSSDWDRNTKPTATLAYLQSSHLPMDKGFNLDNWGGYIAYRTGNRVFIDDRLDFYGEPFFTEYGNVMMLQSNWKDVLAKRSVQWVLFPAKSPLVNALAAQPEWKLVCKDEASALFVHN